MDRLLGEHSTAVEEGRRRCVSVSECVCVCQGADCWAESGVFRCECTCVVVYMCVCVHVCVCTCMVVYMCVCVHVCVCTRVGVYMCVCVHVCVCPCVYRSYM